MNMNRRLMFLCVIVFIFSLIIEAQNDHDFATLNIYRKGVWSGGVGTANLYINGNLICKLHNNSKLTYKIFKEGVYTISHRRKPIKLSINVTLGKNYYIKLRAVTKIEFLLMSDLFGQSEFYQIPENKRIIIEGEKPAYADNIRKNEEVRKNNTTNKVSYIDDPKLNYEKRLALVIGNSTYGGSQVLKNPVNDANLMSSTLQRLGFTVIKRTDADEQSMEEAIREFSRKLPDYNVALFYYAGHGVQVDGTNYLIPTDATLTEKADCKYEAISVNFVVEEFEKYPDNVNIVILDACRNNPFRSWARGAERGFKAITPTTGLIISFATSEGATALDGTGNNGLFTEELVKQMTIPQPIERVFKNTRIEVYRRTNGLQNPMEWTQLTGDFYFVKE